jgi:5-keto 4-deoxyuronate isomerase
MRTDELGNHTCDALVLQHHIDSLHAAYLSNLWSSIACHTGAHQVRVSYVFLALSCRSLVSSFAGYPEEEARLAVEEQLLQASLSILDDPRYDRDND